MANHQYQNYPKKQKEKTASCRFDANNKFGKNGICIICPASMTTVCMVPELLQTY